MTPLFKLPVTGGELVGYENKNCSCKSSYEYAHCKQVCRPSLMNEAWRLENFGSHHFIGPLSEVTEEQAREWGFGEKWDFDSEVYFQLTQGLHHFPDMHTAFSNILLILIKDE